MDTTHGEEQRSTDLLRKECGECSLCDNARAGGQVGKRVGWFCVVLGGGRTGRHAYAHYSNYNQLLSSYCMHLACMLSLQPLDFLQDGIAVCHHDTLQTALHALPAAWNACPGSPSGEFLVIPLVPTSSGKSSLAPKATPGSRFSVPIGPCSRPSWCLL